jgi:hypothetical protein
MLGLILAGGLGSPLGYEVINRQVLFRMLVVQGLGLLDALVSGGQPNFIAVHRENDSPAFGYTEQLTHHFGDNQATVPRHLGAKCFIHELTPGSHCA